MSDLQTQQNSYRQNAIVGSDPANNKFIGCAGTLKTDAVVIKSKGAAAIKNYLKILIVHPELFNKSDR